MAKDKKKSKLSLKERMANKKKELSERGKKGNILFIKEGTTRVRLLPVGPEKEFIAEVTHFYMSNDNQFFSRSVLGEPCPGMEAYHDLKKSKDEDDQELAKKLVPKQGYLMPVVIYKDEKGKEVDTDNSGKLMKITGGVYQQILDLYLDEDEWGDMTDPKNGYDIKIIRTGKGKMDTEYSVVACKNTPLDKKFAKKVVDLEKLVEAEMDPYDVAKEKVDKFLGQDHDDDDDDDKPKKKKDKKKSGDDFGGKKKNKEKDKGKDKKKPVKKDKDKKKSKK